MIHTIFKAQRSAITLVEVIFAIGVIMIGLLGLLSIMPLAGRRSQEAVSFSVGAEMGDSVAKEIQIRRWLGNANYVDFSTSGTVGFDSATNRLQVGAAAITGVCIDPLYCSIQGSPTAFESYDNQVFPYYQATHDPLLDPSNPNSSGWPVAAPRLRRVGLGGMSQELARTVVQSANDLIVEQPTDRSLPPHLHGLRAGRVDYGRRVPSGEFSWIATLVPTSNSRFASLSVVILRNRMANLDFPTSPPTPPVTPADNGNAERTAYVTFASGFSGGAGGVVHLTASNATSSQLTANDWVMLSRRVSAGVEMHRWYRVVSVDAEPEVFVPASNTALDPAAPTAVLPAPSSGGRSGQVWRRRVTLDGPDWDFDFRDASGVIQVSDGSLADNTYATLVPDVVSVTERLIPWTDL